jgi:hypothetical protein
MFAAAPVPEIHIATRSMVAGSTTKEPAYTSWLKTIASAVFLLTSNPTSWWSPISSEESQL